MAEILNNKYGKDYKIKPKEVKFCTAKIVCLYDPTVKILMPFWGKQLMLCNERSKQVLGIKYRSMQETIPEMAESLIAHGQIPDKRKSNK